MLVGVYGMLVGEGVMLWYAGRGGSHVRVKVSYPGDRRWSVWFAAESVHMGHAASFMVAV